MVRRPLSRGLLLALSLLLSARLSLAAQAPAIDFDKLRDEAAQRLVEYLRINTTNPPGNELYTGILEEMQR